MAGIGLANAVAGYQQGVQWRQQQDQIAQQQARAAKQQALEAEREAVNQESAGMMKQALQDHVLRGGKPEEFRPPEDLMFKLGERRSVSFLQRGMVDDFYANEAKLAAPRLQTRARAVQEYEADQDPVKFLMSVNRSVFNGKDVKGVEKISATPGSPGEPPTNAGVRVTFSDGTSHVVDPDAVAKSVKIGLLDPKEYAKKEADAAFERLKQEQHTAGRMKEIDAQGKVSERVATIGADSREAAASTSAQASLDRAHIRGQYGTETARIRGEFQSAAAKARGAGGGGRTSNEVQTFKALELSARSSMESIRKELAAKEALLKDAGSKDRPRIVAAVEALKSELDDARGVHSEIISTMRAPAAAEDGTDNKPAPNIPAGLAAIKGTGNARAEAIGAGEPVQFDLGGKKGSFDARGGLSEVAPGTKPAAAPKAGSNTAAKKAPEAPRDAAQRKANTVYSTPKGDLMWTGKGWKRVDG